MTSELRPATAPVRPARTANGAVASPHHLATGAGVAILHAGGTAVDAAIATNAALAVVAGHSCGLGGDALWLIWDPLERRVLALNGSGRSGREASIASAREAGYAAMPERGPWTVTVPGAIDSWGRAHERFGRLDWADLMEPAIELAGAFPSSPGWSSAVEQAGAVFGSDGDWAATYRAHGRPWRDGEIVRLPALRATLRTIAADGPRTAYDGRLAKRSGEYLAAAGAPLDEHDFAAHSSDWHDPIRTDYRGIESVTHPPNSVGVVALQTLAMLGRFSPPSPSLFDGRGWRSADWVHLGLEASRLALAERDAQVTDPTHMRPETVDEMLSGELIDALVARLDPERVVAPSPSETPTAGGTVYVAAGDRWGGVVSLLESNFMGFGSGLVDPATGIAFQNRGAFFRLEAPHPNRLEPRKRTAHTLAPGLLLRDGLPWIAHGSMGGEIQPQVFTQFVSAVVDGEADVASALAVPRWAARMPSTHGPPELTEVESAMDPDVVAALSRRGHDVRQLPAWDSAMGHAHAIEIVRDGSGETLSFAAASDPRSEGSAAGI